MLRRPRGSLVSRFVGRPGYPPPLWAAVDGTPGVRNQLVRTPSPNDRQGPPRPRHEEEDRHAARLGPIGSAPRFRHCRAEHGSTRHVAGRAGTAAAPLASIPAPTVLYLDGMVGFAGGRDVAFYLSVEQAKKIIDRAAQEWGADVDDQSTGHRAIVRLFMGGRSQFSERRRPVGAFHIRWRYPTHDQATIDRIEWDASLGGSDEEVCQVIDALAGWRLAH
jgi:hypothetical protein